MDGQEEILMGSNDLAHQIVKGKRTKRQRSSSPYKAVTSSSSNGCSGGGGEGEFVSGEYNSNSGSISSPTTYSGIYDGTEEEEEEEEDMANCLILLAQGEGPTPKVENVSTTDRGEKRGARKFTGTVATPTVTRTGFYVYECKTCNRSFPSFQALGGHRASHKKPKATAEEKKRALLVESMNDHDAVVDDDDDDDCQLNKSNLDDPICLQIASSSSSNNNNNNNNKGFHGKKAKKIHECSICGSEFASGQALGGHMRRHRASTANIHTSATNSSGEIKARNILQLDLNLPAPEDDHPHHEFEPSIQFASQQQALVFSAPALVDCHY